MTSTCKYCRKTIYWSSSSGAWIPYEDQGLTVRHQCRKETATPPLESFTPEEVHVLKNLAHLLKPVSA